MSERLLVNRGCASQLARNMFLRLLADLQYSSLPTEYSRKERMMPVIRDCFTGAVLIAAVAFCTVSQGMADPVAEFYKGKRISMMVGSSAGGGYDAYARLVTRHLGKHIPGNPTFVVQNMPGGGGLRVTNYLYNIAPRDGTAMATVQRAILTSPLIEGRNIQIEYDPLKFNWLGSLNSETGLIVVWHTAPHQTMKDLFDKELLVGSSTPATDFLPLFLNNVLNTKLKIVAGYKSSVDVYLAVERGELQGRVSTGWAGDKEILQPWLEKKQVRLLAQLSTAKNPEFPDVPLILDFARNERERQAMELILSSQLWGRPFVMPPDVPKERIEAVRRGFSAMLNDAEFLEEAKKMRMDLDPISGAEIEQLLQRVFSAPPDLVEYTRKSILESKP